VFGLKSMRRAEAVRLIAVVAVAAGAVALAEGLGHGGHGSGSPSSHSAEGSAGQTEGGAAGGGTSPRGAGRQGVTVASGPAVERALRHGSMTVVIDQPSSDLFAEQNQSIAQGAAIAVSALNAGGGLPGHVHIKLVSQSLDGLSPTAVQATLRSEAAAVLILPCDTQSQTTLAAGASAWGLLMLAPCNSDGTAGERYPTYWPVGATARGEAEELSAYMRGVGAGSAFVVAATGARPAELLTEAFRSAAQARGIALSGGASVSITSPDFSGVVRSIKTTSPKPALIFTSLPPPLVNRLASYLRSNGIEQSIVGGTTMDTPLTLSSGAGPLENAAFASYGFPREDPAAARFEAEYRARFGRDPVGSFPGLGFETIRLLASAAHKAGSAEPPAIQGALDGGLTLQGIALSTRTYQPVGDHDPVTEVGVSKVASGSFLPLLASTPTETSGR
jgi:branched-chain amino acid transport system substrate-binding protein